MFKDKYPAFGALILLLATFFKDAEHAIEEDGSLMAKVLEFSDIPAHLVEFIPLAGKMDDEIKTMGPSDYILAAEELVADLKITNGSANNIIRAAFPVVNKLAELQPLVLNLVSTIKSSKEKVA